MTYSLGVALYLVALSATFIFAHPRLRPGLILVSLFTYGVWVDLGIQLEPPKVLAVCCWVAMLFGSVRWRAGAWHRLATEWRPFFLWLVGVWVVGYALVPQWEDAANGWARSSAGKPVVQLLSTLVYVGYVPIMLDGLRGRRDFARFFRWWRGLALLGSSLCIIQVTAAAAFGRPIWGISRGDGFTDMAMLKVFGMPVQRASGLFGEPKQAAMALVISLVMFIVTISRERRSVGSSIGAGVIATAILLTFSTGAFLLLPFLAVGALLRRGTQPYVKRAVVMLVAIGILGAFLYPSIAEEIYTQRVARVSQDFSNVMNATAEDDKEQAAAIYLLRNPWIAVTGVGLGTAPFYYEELIPQPRFLRVFQEPNSGLVWGLYSFGLVGWLLLVRALAIRSGARRLDFDEHATRTILLVVVAFFVVLHPAWWLSLAVGVYAAARATRLDLATIPDVNESGDRPSPSSRLAVATNRSVG